MFLRIHMITIFFVCNTYIEFFFQTISKHLCKRNGAKEIRHIVVIHCKPLTPTFNYLQSSHYSSQRQIMFLRIHMITIFFVCNTYIGNSFSNTACTCSLMESIWYGVSCPSVLLIYLTLTMLVLYFVFSFYLIFVIKITEINCSK
jgi:hypothetical protein